MIRIKKDGRYFDLAPGEALTTKWVSTVFNDDDEFKGSYTYGVKAPFTPNNNTLLNHGHLIENRSARLGTTGIMEIFGQQWKQVKITYGITPDGYELNCLIDNAEFAKIIKERTLPEVFVNFEGGIFKDFVYDLLGSNRQETFDAMVTRAENPGTGSCVFFAQKIDGLYGSFSGQNGAPGYLTNYNVNVYRRDPDYITNLFYQDTRKAFLYNPSYYLRWTIVKVCSFLGFQATGDFFNDPATACLVIDNTGMLDADTLFAVDGGKLAPAKHLPNIKIADFIKQLRASFKLAIYFDGNERRVYFNYAPEILDSADVVDITGYTEKQPTIESYVPTGYKLEQAIDGDDDMFENFEYVKNYFIGDNSEPQKLSSFIGTTFMTGLEVRPGYGSKWRIPRKMQLANVYHTDAAETDAYNKTGYSANGFTFRLLNYVGQAYDSLGYPYFYATSDGANADGSENLDRLSLWMGKDNGLINRYIKKWLTYFLRTEEVEITAHLPGTLLLQLSPIRKLLFTSSTRALIPALINEVNFEQSGVYQNRISAKIKIYPIYNQAATDVKAFTEVQPGEIENEGKIYVKYRLKETGRDQTSAFGVNIVYNIFCAGYLDFFSDEACTKPRNVSNLTVNMIYVYKGANERNYIIDQPFTVVASGTSHQITGAPGEGIYQTYYYRSKKDYWNKYYGFNRAGGNDYTFII